MVKLTFFVEDINTVLSLFTHIRLYRSDSEQGAYVYVADIPLVSNQTTYTYTDVIGTEDNWYRSSYYNVGTSLESSLSDPVRGYSPQLFHNPTYPSEISLSEQDTAVVGKIRVLIGDSKELGRVYCDSVCDHLMDDLRTIDLGETGWPVYISLNDEAKTSLTDPVVNGYRYLTFSGTLSGSTLDVYYYSFRWSDREILEQYNNCIIPPGLTSSTVTTDHLLLQTAINLLESENWRDYIENGARIRDSDTTYDPSPGFVAREKAIARLRKQLDDLINQYKLAGIDGVRVE